MNSIDTIIGEHNPDILFISEAEVPHHLMFATMVKGYHTEIADFQSTIKMAMLG